MKRKLYKRMPICVLACMIMAFTSCGDKTTATEGDGDTIKPLNISIYLDLSDRLLKGGTPDTKTRDLAIVDILSDDFASATKGTGLELLSSENKMKVLFYPAPESEQINALADSLRIDMGTLLPKDKKTTIKELKQKFHDNLSEIYDLTLEAQNWIGCDIWGFFSDPMKIDVQCIEEGARNIVIILTDGFIYHDNNVSKDGKDGYTYVSMKTIADPESYLIADRSDLKDVEVLVLEVAPESLNLKTDQKQKLRSVLENWFKEMGVTKIQIAETDTKANTQTLIERFLK